MDIEVNRMFPAAISRFKTLRPRQRYASLRVRVFFALLGLNYFRRFYACQITGIFSNSL